MCLWKCRVGGEDWSGGDIKLTPISPAHGQCVFKVSDAMDVFAVGRAGISQRG